VNIDLLEKIESTSGKIAKEMLLKGADGDLRLFLEQCLDPDITYGVTTDDDYEQFEPHSQAYNEKKFWSELKAFLHLTASRKLTGNAANNACNLILENAPSRLALKWAIRFINKNLRAGFDISTYNKAFGAGTVEKFSIQLADVYEGEDLIGVYYVQPKLDGNRVVFIDGKAMSRNGKEYPNCEHVIEELTKKDPDFFKKWVLDGEMMGDLGFDKSSGALRRINEKNREKATFTYWAFDLIAKSEWDRRKTRPLKTRLQDLEDVIGKKYKTVTLVPTGGLNSPSHDLLMKLCDDYVKDGFEGAMIKDADSPYVFKRGKNLLKVKKFFDIDLEVVDFYEGKGKHKDRLGGIIVEGDGINCKVGSGFNDAMRDKIWNNKRDWKGAIVQIQYQDKTKDGSLRFPVFVMRRKDKE
jgi:hypothetical protein